MSNKSNGNGPFGKNGPFGTSFSGSCKDLCSAEIERLTELLMSSSEETSEEEGEEDEHLDDDFPPIPTIDLSTRNRPLLTAKEERELTLKLKGNDPKEAKKAWDELVYANTRIIIQMANKYASRYPGEFPDLYQAGEEGLLRALKRFDPKKEVKLLTYALPWIERFIAREVAKNLGAHVPDNKITILGRIRAVRAILISELQEYPTSTQIAERLGISYKEVEKLLQAAEGMSISLDAPISEDSDSTVMDVTVTPDSYTNLPEDIASDAAAKGELSVQLICAVKKVLKNHPVERDVILMRYGVDGHEPHTLAQVATKLGISRERVRQLEKAGLKRLAGDSRLGGFHDFLS